MDIIPVFLDHFMHFFEHDKKHGFSIVLVLHLDTHTLSTLFIEEIVGHAKGGNTLLPCSWH